MGAIDRYSHLRHLGKTEVEFAIHSWHGKLPRLISTTKTKKKAKKITSTTTKTKKITSISTKSTMCLLTTTIAWLKASWSLLRNFIDWHAMMMAFVPYRGKQFIEDYIETCRAIKEGDRMTIYRQRSVQVLLVVFTISLGVVLGLPNKSQWTMIIFFDFLTLSGSPLALSYQMLGLIIMVFYFNEIMYFHIYGTYASDILIHIFSNQNRKFILDTDRSVVSLVMTLLKSYQVFFLLLGKFCFQKYCTKLI